MDTQTWIESLKALINFAQKHPNTDSTNLIASMVWSLTNWILADLRLLDQTNFEHILNVLKLYYSKQCDIEQLLIDNGFNI